MAEYTYKDIIIDPESEEAKNAIGKEVYYTNWPMNLLKFATEDKDKGILTIASGLGFLVNDTFWQCIIVKKEEPYPERAKKWIEENDLKVGDYVKIIRKVNDKDGFWNATWIDEMDDYVDKTLKISKIIESKGYITLENNCIYPYFVLEKVEPPKPKYVPFESKEEFIAAYIDAVPIFKAVDDDCITERLNYYGVWLRLKETGILFQVTAIGNKAICVCGGRNDIDWKDLSKDYEFLNNTPCGKKVKDEF